MITFDDFAQTQSLKDLRTDEEESLIKSLSDTYGLPYIDLRGMAPEGDALRMIPQKDAREGNMVPFKISGHKLYIALLSPNNTRAEELIRGLETRGSEIFLFLCSHASLNHAWGRYDELEQTSRVDAGTLNLTKEGLSRISQDLKSLDDLKHAFDSFDGSQILYKTSRVIELIFAGALSFDASDIHIEPEENKVKLRYRIDGVLTDIAFLDHALMKLMNSRLKLLAGLKLSTTGNSQDGRFSIDLEEVEIEVRVSIIPGNYGESFVMRLLDPRDTVTNIEEMGMSSIVYDKVTRALARPNGVILTTGPTGSGKSTTLYAFLRKLNSPDIKIITIEDPIEYHLEGITQTQVEEEKEYTFLSGLRSVLRQDPDVIMVGEIRDEDTAKVAINAALTGHLVFSTLHTNNAAGTIPRLIDLKINPKIIASALSLALAQRLVRKLCVNCKVAVDADEKEAKIITETIGNMVSVGKGAALGGRRADIRYTLYKPVGCDRCTHGYKGRIGIYEALMMSPEIERLLATNPSEREIKDAMIVQGIPTLKEDALMKVLDGITSFEEVGKVVDLYEV